jgi:predicted small integral membrane protein
VSDGVEFFLTKMRLLHLPGRKRVAIRESFRFKFAPFTNERGDRLWLSITYMPIVHRIWVASPHGQSRFVKRQGETLL